MHRIAKFLFRKKLQRIHAMYVVAFLLSVSQALVVYWISAFLAEYVGIENTGFFFTIAFAISLLGVNIVPKLLSRNGVLFTAILIAIAYMISLALMGFGTSTAIVVIGFIMYMIGRVIFSLINNILLERNSTDALTGGIRGIYLTSANLGWFVSAYLSGILNDLYGIRFIFFLSGLLIIPVIIILLSNFKFHEFHLFKEKYNFKKTLKKMIAHKNLRNNFILSMLMSTFFSFMTIYTPIYLHSNIGLSWTNIGLIFSIMLIPFILLEVPAGKLADLFLGEKELLSLGLIITAIFSISLTFVTSTNLYVWMILLFMTRVGASLMEVMNETFFYKLVDGSDTDLINFRTNFWPLAYVIGPLIGSLTVYLFSIQYVFLVIGVIMLGGLFFSLQLKDTK